MPVEPALTIASLLRYTRCSIIRDNEYSRQLKEEEEVVEEAAKEEKEEEEEFSSRSLRNQSKSLLRGGRPVVREFFFNVIRRRGRSFSELLEDHQLATGLVHGTVRSHRAQRNTSCERYHYLSLCIKARGTCRDFDDL